MSLKQAGNDMFKRGQYTEAAYLYQSALDIIGQGTCTVSEVLCAWVCLKYSMRSPLLGPQHVTEALPRNITLRFLWARHPWCCRHMTRPLLLAQAAHHTARPLWLCT